MKGWQRVHAFHCCVPDPDEYDGWRATYVLAASGERVELCSPDTPAPPACTEQARAFITRPGR